MFFFLDIFSVKLSNCCPSDKSTSPCRKNDLGIHANKVAQTGCRAVVIGRVACCRRTHRANPLTYALEIAVPCQTELKRRQTGVLFVRGHLLRCCCIPQWCASSSTGAGTVHPLFFCAACAHIRITTAPRRCGVSCVAVSPRHTAGDGVEHTPSHGDL